MDANVTEKWKAKAMDFMNKIPGYKGYRDRETARDEDGLLRTAIAKDLNSIKQRLLDLAIPLSESEASDIKNPEEIERVKKAVDKVVEIEKLGTEFDDTIEKIRDAPYGYSSLWEQNEVNEEVLQKMQDFDRSLAEYIAVLDESIDPIEDAIEDDDDLKEILKSPNKILREMRRSFRDREKIIKGVKY